jgi:hypothetical protein
MSGKKITLLFLLVVMVFAAVAPVTAKGGNKNQVSGDLKGGRLKAKGSSATLDYDAGTCSGECSISSGIPANAENVLEFFGYLIASKVTVQVTGGSGDYTLCFKASKLLNPVIMRWTGSGWVMVDPAFKGNKVCTTFWGSWSYALVDLDQAQ